MKQLMVLLTALTSVMLCKAQNVGIGTTTPLEKLHVVGNKAYFQTSFLGLGTNTPTTAFSGFTMKNNVNTFYGMYVDAGLTGQPFYGYALNGVATAYHQFNGATQQFEYYHSSGSTPDFLINNTQAAFQNAGFLGVGTATPTTASTGLTIKNNVNNFYGMYVDAGATGQPFYGYALNGVAAAYHQLNGTNGQYEYYHSSGSVPDFQIGNTAAAFRNASFLGVGTATPTTGFTGFAIKSNVNNFWGTYVDAGATGIPFYGYALNGVPKSYSSFNSASNSFEYHQTSDATPDFLINGNTKAVFNTGFVGIGTNTPTTGFTGFTMKNNVNTYYGSYIDAGATGIPFYGYALNGVATAYTTYNGQTNRFEYHHTADATPDFAVSNTQALFPIQNFIGLGTSTPTTGFTGFTMKNNVNTYYGSYVDAGATGIPFYGYALNGVPKAYTTFSGPNDRFEYHHTADATPDFAVSNTQAIFPIQSFIGLGTSTPTTGFTGLTMKNNVNTYYGSYVDAGTTGIPFYGYALNGTPTAYTTYNGQTNQFEYHHTADATPDFAVSNTQALFPIQTFLGLGTSTPTTGSATGFTMKNNVNSFYGMYIDAGTTGEPFYGYALNGVAKAWTEFNGGNNNWELNYGGARIDVNSSGNVGIGTPAPTAKLSVNGTANNTTGAWGVFSDARIKTIDNNFEEGLEVIIKMHPVKFNYNANAPFSAGDEQIGIVAQELEKIAPYMVSKKEIGNFKDLREVNNQAYVFLLINAVKEQQNQIEAERKNNEALVKQNLVLQQEMEKLKEQVNDKLATLEIKMNTALALQAKQPSVNESAVKSK